MLENMFDERSKRANGAMLIMANVAKRPFLKDLKKSYFSNTVHSLAKFTKNRCMLYYDQRLSDQRFSIQNLCYENFFPSNTFIEDGKLYITF